MEIFLEIFKTLRQKVFFRQIFLKEFFNQRKQGSKPLSLPYLGATCLEKTDGIQITNLLHI